MRSARQRCARPVHRARRLSGAVPQPDPPGEDPARRRARIRVCKSSGAMEARLTSADLVIIAGLNEGTWPEAADPGPWLNRSMRAALGLPSPERRIRLAAHDFCQMLGAGEVVLTRSLKSGGAPTVPSRWLMRIEALLQGAGASTARWRRRQPWAQWSAARNSRPMPRPPPEPPCALPAAGCAAEAPQRLRHPAADRQPLRDLRQAHPRTQPAEPARSGAGRRRARPDHPRRAAPLRAALSRARCRLPARRELLAIFDDCAALYGDHARISAFWRPRLERFAAWFEETEPARRRDAQVLTEVPGELHLRGAAGAVHAARPRRPHRSAPRWRPRALRL